MLCGPGGGPGPWRSSRRVLASAAGGPLASGCSVQVSMGVLVGGARRKGKLGRGCGPHPSAADLAGVSRGMRAVSQNSTHGHRRADKC